MKSSKTTFNKNYILKDMNPLSKLTLVLSVALMIYQQTPAQTKLNLAAGYYAENTISPGLVIELEREKFHSDLLSIPVQLDLIGFINPDYSGVSLELKSGFRKYFNNGLFIEQNIGIGYQFTKYRTDLYYTDKYFYSVPHGNKLTPWLSASTSLGVGYKIGPKKDGNHLIWFRPKLYWLPGFRGIHLPYHAFQLGYTRNLKSN